LASKAIERTPLNERNSPDNANSPLMQKTVEGRQPIVFLQFQDSRGNRQIEAGSFFPDIGQASISIFKPLWA
jgi:hypothetical protein